jgi:hypothetical protein
MIAAQSVADGLLRFRGLDSAQVPADHMCGMFAELPVCRTERGGEMAVDIQFADHLARNKDWHNDF